MAAKNQTSVAPGETVTLDIYLRSYYNGPLIDADSVPTFIVYDPNDVELYSGTASHPSTGVYEASYTVSSTADLSDTYKIVWSAIISGVAVPHAWEYFRVVAATSEYDGISISSGWLNQVKKVTAYPEVANLTLSDDEIKEFAVFPAMTRYFTKFPKSTSVEYEANSDSSLTVDFPDDYTFGLLDCRVVNVGMLGGTGSSFWDIAAYQRFGSYGNTSSYGQRGYNPNSLYQERYNQRFAMKSQINSLATIKFDIDLAEREVNVYTSVTGRINLTWAKYSTNFEDIKYQRKFDVIQLAQAELLDWIADTFGMTTDGTLDVDINVADIRSRAKELRDEVVDKWKEFPATILLKAV